MKKIASAFCMTLAVLWLRLGHTDTVENEPEVIVGFKGGPGGEKKKTYQSLPGKPAMLSVG